MVAVPGVGIVVIDNICKELFAGFGGVLAEGLGPETVAMGIVGVAIETDVAGAGDELFDATEIGVEFGIGINAEEAIFEGAAEGEGHFFFETGVEGDGFDFGTEALFGALGQLDAHAAGVNAATLHLWERQDGKKFGFDFGEWFVAEFEADAVPDDVANLRQRR